MAFDKTKFIEQFKAEIRDHLQALNLGLLKLEKDSGSAEHLKELMRHTHTVKGTAAMMGYARIRDIAHLMEGGMERALKGSLQLEKKHFEVLFKAFDTIDKLLEDKVAWADKGPFVDELCAEIKAGFGGGESAPAPSQPKEAEIPVDIPLPAAAKTRAAAAEESLRVDVAKLSRVMNISGELLISKISLGELAAGIERRAESDPALEEALGPLLRDLKAVSENMDRLTSDMQDQVMTIRMVPVAHLFNIFPRAMRDLALGRGKDAEFSVRGEETQLDKAILDELKDPIMHLLRNALDHGLEPPGERRKKGKPERGRISLAAYQEGSQVVIEVRDDGAGINVAVVKEKAVKNGLLPRDKAEAMPPEQVYQLLFTPGFSTREEVTDISGRGVGLDVVAGKVEQLKGMIEVLSKEGEGTAFVMRLPLTLAITESLLVVAGTDTFAIPIDAVVETVRINPAEIKAVETKEAVSIRGRILPLVRLGDIFGLPRRGIVEKKSLPVVVVQSAEKRVGILVDKLLNRQEIIGKRIGDPLTYIRHIAGATILGSGRVVLIVDVPSVIEAAEGGAAIRPQAAPSAAPRTRKKRTILLAEDVLTTAMLEKNILESVGYSVVIARDGREALEKARQETFNLIITDVLMPRMDGFELVEALRADSRYRDVPVVIVTSRESDDDRKRGLEVGADAYILKHEFTSEGLLDTLERLLG